MIHLFAIFRPLPYCTVLVPLPLNIIHSFSIHVLASPPLQAPTFSGKENMQSTLLSTEEQRK